jgi:FkbM family methyltransferase
MNKITIFNSLRKLTRKLGLNSLLFKIIYNGNSYEELFDNFFRSKLKSDFCVYDIGSNMGLYSIEFAKIVGSGGKVFSFEPSAINFNKLTDNVKNISNIITINNAVGRHVSKLFISQGIDEIGATSKLNGSKNGLGNWVDVTTIDELITKLAMPNAIKIDVEGFEINVLQGAQKTLMNQDLKVVGVEIHSTILDEQGIKNPVEKIEKIFKESGFLLKWTDFSHVVAYRP